MAWNGSSGAEAPRRIEREAPSKRRGLVALFAVIILGGVVMWLFMRLGRDGSDQACADKSGRRIVDMTEEVANGQVSLSGSVSARSRDDKFRGKTAAVRDKGNGTVSGGVDSDEPELDEQAPEQPQKEKPRKVFKHGTDQLIYLTVFASKGGRIPPLPPMTPEDTDRYIKSLRDPIDLDPDDPPQILEMKKGIDKVRKQIAELIAQEPERSLSEILNAHRDEFNAAQDLRADAQKAYDQLIEEGDEEGAAQYLEKANELLEQYGADPIAEEETEEESAE